jgi:hypothetical protein
MNLTRLIYTSIAFPGINLAILEEILLSAEKNNSKKKITGALCYGSGQFLQVLEGDQSTISALYNYVSQDKRHFEVEIIEVTSIKKRDFEQWSMQYVYFNTLTNANQLSMVKRITHSDKFSPRLWSAEQCLSVMIELTK